MYKWEPYRDGELMVSGDGHIKEKIPIVKWPGISVKLMIILRRLCVTPFLQTYLHYIVLFMSRSK